MHVTLLSRSLMVRTTRRLAQAAQVLGHRVVVIDPSDLQVAITAKGPQLLRGRRKPGRTDVVIPRIAASITGFGTALVNQYAISGVPVLNDAVGIANARNKMRLMQMLVHAGLHVPPTVHGKSSARHMLQWSRLSTLVGGFPVVIKLVQSQEISGVIVCESAQSMEAIAQAVLALGNDILVQKYVNPSKGRDVRALVLGGEVIAAVQRQPTPGEFHFHLSAGAWLTKVKLTTEQTQLALAAAKVVGLRLAAVDMLHLKSGETQVFEVHSSPGLSGMERATGKDLATPIVQYALDLARAK